MNGETIITWNFVNWVTIVLMALVGFAIVGTVAHLVDKKTGDSNAGN
jgi:hypothetical protein